MKLLGMIVGYARHAPGLALPLIRLLVLRLALEATYLATAPFALWRAWRRRPLS